MTWSPKKIKKGYIANTVTNVSKPFQFNPVSLDNELEANYEDEDNRNIHPYQGWTGSGEKILFSLRFMRRPGYDANGAVHWLRSLTQPYMKNGKLQEPPLCIVTIGSGSWKVKVRKVTITYNKWQPSGVASDFDVMIECTSWSKVPKPPDPAKNEPKKTNEKPYEYLITPQTKGATSSVIDTKFGPAPRPY